MEPLEKRALIVCSLVDASGNALRIHDFYYEFPQTNSGDDADWICCKMTIETTVLKKTVNGFLRAEEVTELITKMTTALDSLLPEDLTFEPMEPYLELSITRKDDGIFQPDEIVVTSRLDLHPCLGPVIEYSLECSLESVRNFVSELNSVAEAFPPRQ
jgi:hypothetical protein